MTTETELRDTLRRAAATIPNDNAHLGEVVRQGRYRRQRSRGVTVASVVVVLAAIVGLSSGMFDLPGAAPFASQAPAERTDVVIYLCSVSSVNSIPEPGEDPPCDEVATDAQINQLRAALELDEAVASVRYESEQQAHERSAEDFADLPHLMELVDPELLPRSLRVTLVDSAAIDEVVRYYGGFDGVDQADVVDPHWPPAE